MRQFIYVKKTGKPSNPVGFGRAMAIAMARVIQGHGPFRLRKNDQDVGPIRTRIEVLARLRRSLSAGKIGDQFWIEDGDATPAKPSWVFKVREAKPAYAIIDTSGNNQVDIIWSAARAEFPRITFLGAYVCKNILGTSIHSQHSYGNAVDIGAATQADLVIIAYWVVARAVDLKIEHVIVGDKIWTRGMGWHTYTGEYHAHVHIDAYPNFDPALPCGVRN